MSPTDARILNLLAELRRDWSAVIAHQKRGHSVDPTVGAPESALVALSLDHAYQAFESFLVRLELGLGLPKRAGATWHGSLLEDASLAIDGLRPALLDADAARSWRELLKFRHFLRHAYTIELDANELSRNREHLDNAIEATSANVALLFSGLS